MQGFEGSSVRIIYLNPLIHDPLNPENVIIFFRDNFFYTMFTLTEYSNNPGKSDQYYMLWSKYFKYI